MTGLSRSQVTRLIIRYKQSGRVSERTHRRKRFASHYTPADIELLAQVDENAYRALSNTIYRNRAGFSVHACSRPSSSNSGARKPSG